MPIRPDMLIKIKSDEFVSRYEERDIQVNHVMKLKQRVRTGLFFIYDI